ncbi:MAG: hypothetical protein QM757_01885 [Paludibaculum sp.]
MSFSRWRIEQVGAVRPVQRAAGGGVAVAPALQHVEIDLFDLIGRPLPFLVEEAGEAQAWPRGTARRRAPASTRPESRLTKLVAGMGHGDAEFGHLLFQCRQPDGIGPVIG